ncbi:MAG: DUF1924 domain-containing protein [Thiobacillaceae bacterium]
MRLLVCLLTLSGLSLPVLAETPADFLSAYARDAKAGNPAFAQLSSERGRQFFFQTHGKEWSCTSCHTPNPAAVGKHAVTHKTIDPMAPAVNAARFTHMHKVEKWFKRNCNDVLGRACTAQEKGDVLTYLLTIR